MKSIKHLILLISASLSILASAPLLAHTDAVLDTQKAPNGGQLRMAGVYHFELVLPNDQQREHQHDTKHDTKQENENQILIFVTDHAGTKIPTTGATGTATIMSGKQKATVTLIPDGDNKLKGVGKFAASADTKVVVSITMAGKPAEQARFTPQAVAKHAH